MEKDFNSWNEEKKRLQKRLFTDYVHEREVWWCTLGVNLGFEQDGKHALFERPVLVIKKFNKDVVLIVPLTTKAKDNKYHINFVHKDETFSAVISQLRLISTKRLRRKMYVMDSRIFSQIIERVKMMI